jgi:hypothetical protein
MKEKQLIIRGITTNKGKTFDQYTVYFYNNLCLNLSANPDSPQGISQLSEYFGINDLDFEEAAIEGKKINGSETIINFFDLPPIVQSHIEKRIKMKD